MENVRRALQSAIAAALSVALSACGGSPSRPSGGTPVPAPAPGYEAEVQSVTDGDTIRINPPVLGATSVRFLNVDAPERGGSTQEPWAGEATVELAGLLPVATRVRLETDTTPLDSFGRLLAHVVRVADGQVVNRELLRRGRVSLYVIWPNTARFEEYRAAQLAAVRDGLGIWQPGRTLQELPFEYRRRQEASALTRPVGDYFTRFYVPAASFASVPAANRVFFSSTAEADSAGFRPCPLAGGDFPPTCFGPPG
jgi:endonuclease YncB( thermonuclease family)